MNGYTPEVEYWTVEEIMNTVTGSVDQGSLDSAADWQRLLYMKFDSPRRISMIDDIMENGILDPIEILPYAGRQSEDEIVIGNGHHRLILAILCGLDTVPVIVTDRLCGPASTRSGKIRFRDVDEADSAFYHEVYRILLDDSHALSRTSGSWG